MGLRILRPSAPLGASLKATLSPVCSRRSRPPCRPPAPPSPAGRRGARRSARRCCTGWPTCWSGPWRSSPRPSPKTKVRAAGAPGERSPVRQVSARLGTAADATRPSLPVARPGTGRLAVWRRWRWKADPAQALRPEACLLRVAQAGHR